MYRGQRYDGAGNMSGIIQGAAARIPAKYLKAICVHCSSHKLNLCILHSYQVNSVTNMMDTITCLANFLKLLSSKTKSSRKSC